jgi:hypothetical protein
MVAPLTETGNECNNEKGSYEGSSEIKMLRGYYISCKDNENMYKLVSLKNPFLLYSYVRRNFLLSSSQFNCSYKEGYKHYNLFSGKALC